MSDELTIENIKKLQNDKFLKAFQITTVVNKLNIHELNEMYKLMEDLEVDSWRIINMDPIGRALDNNNLSLNASNIEPKNVDILSFLAKNPSIASVKNSIIVTIAHTLGPWYVYTNGKAKAPNNLVVVIRFTNTSSIIFNALYFISIILWNIILFVNAKILCYN